jgi:hypothetical protein
MLRTIFVVGCIVLASEAGAQQNLTKADAPSYPLVEPSSGNLTCAPEGKFLPWLNENWCIYNNQIIQISKDPSALALVTVGGTVGAGHTVTLNFIVNGTTRAVSYVTQSGDTTTTVASALVAAIQANGSLFTPPSGGLPGTVTYITNSFNGGLSFTPTIAFDYDSRQTLQLTWSSTGLETLIIDAACATSCPKLWDNNPSFIQARKPGTLAPPSNSVIGNWIVVGAQSNSPNLLTVQYGNASVQVQNSTTGSIMSRFVFVVPDNNGALNRGTILGYEGAYPVSDNNFWSGHQSMRWSHVWGYIGDFKTGLTVNNQTGITGCHSGLQITGGVVTGTC